MNMSSLLMKFNADDNTKRKILKQFRDLGTMYQKIGLTQAVKNSKIMVIQVK